MRSVRRLCVVVPILLGLSAAPAAAQDLGHRIMGTLGIDAGTQPEPGLYVVDQLGYYSADRLRNRDGGIVPVEGFDLDAIANGIGLAVTFEIPSIATYVSAAVGFPLASVSVSADRPRASLDNWGIGDVYLRPLQLGWRVWQLDVVVSYGLYVPTDLFRLGSGSLSRGHVTHELSAGATAYFDDARTWRLSARASYDLNHRKRGIDITRGDTVYVQGGAGATFFGFLDLGVVGYALWQVRDDRGSDLPPVLRGARDRTFGLGGEIGVRIPSIRLRLGLRYAGDIGVEARPEGQILVFTATWAAWSPGR